MATSSSAAAASAAAKKLAQQSHDLTAAWFFGTVFESALYAAYLLTFGTSIYYLFHIRGTRVSPNRIFLGISVALFIAITLV
jgi:hypothetical protein